MNKVDYIIVGQGIAGTVVAQTARRLGFSVMVIDESKSETASKVSAGLVNPITGRKFVTSWMMNDLLPAVKSMYQEFSDLLGVSFYEPKNIIRAFANNAVENNWEVRASVPSFEQYVELNPDLGQYKNAVTPAFGYGEVTGGGQVDVPLLLELFRAFLKKENILLEEAFDYQDLVIEEEAVFYKDIQARKIIFCEGIGIENNPFFNYLPIVGNKGEVLIVKIPNLDETKIIKQGIFLIPLGDSTYWVGSNYFRRFEEIEPSEEGRQILLKKLEKALIIPFEIIRHRAAIRPTVPDRRPLIGVHPKLENVVLFNGMGAKGASIAPYWANQLFLFLEEKQPLLKEVNIERYRSIDNG